MGATCRASMKGRDKRREQMSSWVVYAKLYALAVPVFFAIDMVWLGLVAKTFYRSRLSALLRTDVNWTAAFAFYFI
jgi:uncharacterized membrane protein